MMALVILLSNNIEGKLTLLCQSASSSFEFSISGPKRFSHDVDYITVQEPCRVTIRLIIKKEIKAIRILSST